MARRRTSSTDSPLFPPDPAADATDWDLIDRVLASPRVRTLYLWGPPGLGKTHSAYHSGRLDGGVYAVTLTEDTPAAELRGHFVPRGSEVQWHDGPCTTAMRRGARLVLNEVSHAAPEALSFLHPVLESFDTARLTLPTNETVTPAPGFHVVCTDNTPPSDLPAALRDRFDCTLEVRHPHPLALAKLREPYRTAAARCAALEEERRISLRGWFGLQSLEGELGLASACAAVFGAERGAQVLDGLVLLCDQLGLDTVAQA